MQMPGIKQAIRKDDLFGALKSIHVYSTVMRMPSLCELNSGAYIH